MLRNDYIFISSSDYFLHFLDGLSLNRENKHLKFPLTFYEVQCLFRWPLIRGPFIIFRTFAHSFLFC